MHQQRAEHQQADSPQRYSGELGMDLDEYRRKKRLTYAQLAKQLGLTQSRQAQAYARGEYWPSAERIEDFLARTEQKVTVLAMHRRRLQWLRANKKLRRSELLPSAAAPAAGR